MKRYFIEDAQCGITEGGMACGPVGGNVVATVRFKESPEAASQWLSVVEVTGIPNYYLFDRDMHDKMIEEDFEDKEFWDDMDRHYINEFNGLSFEEYTDTLCDIQDNPDNPAAPLFRYLLALVRCDMDDIDKLVGLAIGKYADELDFPASDIEEEYLEELALEEELESKD